ncbi:MAG: SUMF1/EgtB/PvdO family nonheme iron enzyme [Proteobacteria bacterium]|nr:SUMF1/EgtB/PvdO family nonheme iron enzyme [Pseudomonadota bacterium]
MSTQDPADTFAREHGLQDSVAAALSQLLKELAVDEPKKTPAPVPDPAARDRYEVLGDIGKGGMGEVRRVHDPDLKRTMAMKVIRQEMLSNAEAVARFVEEAQATAQLDHPGIVPVHELGKLSDGRLYFTMKEVHGDTFGTVIKALHVVSDADAWGSIEGWTFRRAVDAFHAACEAVAYAHSRGVVHRDIKPANIMVGSFGEVQVMDWGLAKVGTGRPDPFSELGPVATDRSADREQATMVGTVAGTPWYMAPEQARGQVHRLGPPADVYALGAVLYTLLCGRPPYEGKDGTEVLQKVTTSFYTPLSSRTTPPLPEGLVEICERAMRRNDQERYPSAKELADALAAWLDGDRKKAQARTVVEHAQGLGPRVAAWREEAKALREQAQGLLDEVEGWRPAEDKRRAWALEDEAEALERRAEQEKLEVTQTLHAALTIAPDLASAHALLAERYREEHTRAEEARDRRGMARAEASLRAHTDALPTGHAERAAHVAYLQGDGQLTLASDPPVAEVRLFEYRLQERRLVPVLVSETLETPLVDHALPMGSYVAEIVRGDRPVVQYPLALARLQELDAGRVTLPEELGQDDCYVPAGWFVSGGDDEALDPLPRRRLWCAGFVMRRHPVINREYIAFLDAVAEQKGIDAALALAPREIGKDGEAGTLIYGQDAGRFRLVPDRDGDIWDLDWPVFNIDVAGARAYCAWRADEDGLAWRLPVELEWEKASRGADGRFFPWGDQLDPSWCCMRESHADRPLPATIHAFEGDVSPYGVRGMGGNVRDLCADAFKKEGLVDGDRVVLTEAGVGDRLVARGGRWSGHARSARVCSRSGVAPTARLSNLGFRMARSLD